MFYISWKIGGKKKKKSVKIKNRKVKPWRKTRNLHQPWGKKPNSLISQFLFQENWKKKKKMFDHSSWFLKRKRNKVGVSFQESMRLQAEMSVHTPKKNVGGATSSWNHPAGRQEFIQIRWFPSNQRDEQCSGHVEKTFSHLLYSFQVCMRLFFARLCHIYLYIIAIRTIPVKEWQK